MGIVKFVTNRYVKSSLTKLTEGNMGSTVIGAIALMLLSINVDFDAVGNLLSGAATPNNFAEAAKVVAGIVLGAWAWKVGKREAKEKSDNSTNARTDGK